MEYRISLDMKYFKDLEIKEIEKYKAPYLRYNDSALWVLKSRYRKWFSENNISYSIEDNQGEHAFYIVFENKADAMLFKLTWL